MNIESLLTDLANMVTRIREGILGSLPDILGAILLIIIGFALARLSRAVVSRLLTNPERLIPYRKTRQSLQFIRIDPSVIRVISGIVYWTVLLLFLAASTEVFGLLVVTTWLGSIANYLPRILTAALIVVFGFIGANLLSESITRTAASLGVIYAETLTKLARLTIILLSFLIATDLVGLDISLLINMIYLLVGALLLGAALAFGLGSKNFVANILASFYLQKTYEVGQRVRVGSVEGRIVQITPTALILQTPEARVLVPANTFSTERSSLLQEES